MLFQIETALSSQRVFVESTPPRLSRAWCPRSAARGAGWGTPSQPQNEQRGSWRADGPEPTPSGTTAKSPRSPVPDAALLNRAQLLKQAADPAYQKCSVSVDKSMGVLKPTQPAAELRQVILLPSLPRKHVCLQHLDVPLKPQTLGGEGSEPTLGAGPAPLAHLPSPRGLAKAQREQGPHPS